MATKKSASNNGSKKSGWGGMTTITADRIKDRKKQNCIKSGGKWVNGSCQF